MHEQKERQAAEQHQEHKDHIRPVLRQGILNRKQKHIVKENDAGEQQHRFPDAVLSHLIHDKAAESAIWIG